MLKSSRRDKYQIIQEILGVCKKGMNKTGIMHKVNLSFNQLGLYLEFLGKNGLIERKNEKNRKILYKTTEKGLEVYKKIRDCYSFFS
jgi:predicted transcriptional regulator